MAGAPPCSSLRSAEISHCRSGTAGVGTAGGLGNRSGVGGRGARSDGSAAEARAKTVKREKLDGKKSEQSSQHLDTLHERL